MELNNLNFPEKNNWSMGQEINCLQEENSKDNAKGGAGFFCEFGNETQVSKKSTENNLDRSWKKKMI